MMRVVNLTAELALDCLPPPRSPIVLTIESPGGHKVEVSGRVIWTTAELRLSPGIPSGFGVQVEEGIRGWREFFESLLLS
jgi:hypothetical protein